MKKTILYSLLALAFITVSYSKADAQYKNAIGGRFGTANGITFKTFNKKTNAYDFILNFQSSTNYSAFRFTALYEIHNEFNNADGLRWYYGFGGTVGSRKYKPTDESDVIAGIDGVIGLDYKFKEAPINLSLDWKPTLEVSPNTEFDGEALALSLRFTF